MYTCPPKPTRNAVSCHDFLYSALEVTHFTKRHLYNWLFYVTLHYIKFYVFLFLFFLVVWTFFLLCSVFLFMLLLSWRNKVYILQLLITLYAKLTLTVITRWLSLVTVDSIWRCPLSPNVSTIHRLTANCLLHPAKVDMLWPNFLSPEYGTKFQKEISSFSLLGMPANWAIHSACVNIFLLSNWRLIISGTTERIFTKW